MCPQTRSALEWRVSARTHGFLNLIFPLGSCAFSAPFFSPHWPHTHRTHTPTACLTPSLLPCHFFSCSSIVPAVCMCVLGWWRCPWRCCCWGLRLCRFPGACVGWWVATWVRECYKWRVLAGCAHTHKRLTESLYPFLPHSSPHMLPCVASQVHDTNQFLCVLCALHSLLTQPSSHDGHIQMKLLPARLNPDIYFHFCFSYFAIKSWPLMYLWCRNWAHICLPQGC